MQKIQAFLERLHRTKNQQQYDAVIPVVGDEGKGKSTFMIEATGRWQAIKGEEPTPESVLDRVVWDGRDEFKSALANYPRVAAIPVMDAAHVLYKRDAMQSEQKEAEKGLLDVRTRSFLILLGYQAWGDIPSTLQDRRAKYALRIPRRGRIEGYSRATLNEKQTDLEDSEWPDPDLVDTFPNLEGTDLWAEFKDRDRQHKRQRLAGDPEEDEQSTEQSVREIAAEIEAEGIERVVSVSASNKQPYINADLIEVDYGVSARKAKKVKSYLEREVEVPRPA